MTNQMEMWVVYAQNLLNNHINKNVFLVSLVFSAVFYLLFKRTENLKKKAYYLTFHIILLFFPFVFAAVFWNCMMNLINCAPKIFLFFTPIAIAAAVLLGFIVLPFAYNWHRNNSKIDEGFIKEFVHEESAKLKIGEPEIYSINEIEPMAYSITNLKRSIFVSVGLSELLTKKELESVLLHELYHHKSKAYFWKFSFNMLRIFTPLSTFASESEPMKKEEMEADSYAVSVQGTSKYLNSAKRKMQDFILTSANH